MLTVTAGWTKLTTIHIQFLSNAERHPTFVTQLQLAYVGIQQ